MSDCKDSYQPASDGGDEGPDPADNQIELTALVKSGGPLTKRIGLAADGSLHSDGSACVMSAGSARRMRFKGLNAFAACINGLNANEAIALGVLDSALPDRIGITTKRRLERLNGTATPNLIARTGDHIAYRPGRIALALIDIDTKGMPASVQNRIDELGGIWSTLLRLVPELESVGHVFRHSTSSGLRRADTGDQVPGSSSVHVYVLLKDGQDVERFLKTLHARCWLRGLGWMMVGAAGQLLERSIIDRMVYAAERLVFEGPPILAPPLVQDLNSRCPQAREGGPLDSRRSVPDLSTFEKEQLKRIKAQAALGLASECRKARQAFISRQAVRLVEKGVTANVARRTVERLADSGVLLPDVELPFDLPEFAGGTVADVLADPERFVDATLADPVEGVAYGVCKARIMQREDGSLWIHSFAHGRTVYELKFDANRLRDLLAKVPDTEVVQQFVRFSRRVADLADLEYARIRLELIKRLKIGVREFDRHVKRAVAAEQLEDAQARDAERQRERQVAGDDRPQLRVPAEDTPHLEVSAQLDSVFAASTAAEPPMRNLEGYLAMALVRRVPGMHLLTSAGSNAEELATHRVPAPEHVLLTALTEIETAKLVEQYIDYISVAGRSVRLPEVFVRAYNRQRAGSPLPVVHSVATMPVILPDGAILSGHYLDRQRQILFRVPQQLERALPRPEDCTSGAVAAAIAFLADEWLVDVPADYRGKLKLIALATTVLQRSVLPERPCFFVTAGQRGNGKSTAVTMNAMATLGQRVSAVAWSHSAEERRKALLSYFGEGVPLICWDNIKRGATIACPSIEKALTAETYTDRILGVTESRTVSATSIMCFTGNNIGPRGDMASRSLVIRLSASRADPENRPFKHADPIGWTAEHRGEILHALYTILLGNPRLTDLAAVEPETRFKTWWHLIGAAIEHASRCHLTRPDLHSTAWPPVEITFRQEFLDNDVEDEQGHALSIVLSLLRGRWPGTFQSSDILSFSKNTFDPDVSAFSAEFFDALEAATGLPPAKAYSARTLTWRLKAIVDAPAPANGKLMQLRFAPHHGGGWFSVEELP
jgi:hypothetical protein